MCNNSLYTKHIPFKNLLQPAIFINYAFTSLPL